MFLLLCPSLRHSVRLVGTLAVCEPRFGRNGPLAMFSNGPDGHLAARREVCRRRSKEAVSSKMSYTE